MVTVEMPPAFRSTATASTPSMASSSSLTADTQCPQVMPETLMVVVVGEVVLMACSFMWCRRWPGWCGGVSAKQPTDGVGSFLYLGIDGFCACVGVRLGGRPHHAVADVFLDQPQADGVQGLGD